MPRKPLIISDTFPYHITNRSNNREFWYVPTDFLWETFLLRLKYLEEELGCIIHGFVLMSNHYHLVIQTPRGNIHEAMKYLHREVAKKSNIRARRINHFFGGRYTWSLIDNEPYYWNAMKYVFQNPLRAGLVQKVEDYQFSSLNDCSEIVSWKMREWLGEKNVHIDREWLNELFTPEESGGISRGLRKATFALPRIKTGHQLRINAPACRKGTITF